MKTPLLSEDFANKVFDILVSHCGAREDERPDFIWHHCKYLHGCMEFRFRGHLGFGGKYRSKRNCVTYYPEDQTVEKDTIEKMTNEALSKI